jgi:transposase
MFYLGIDVSKLKLDCMLLVDLDGDKRKSKVVPNTAEGVKALVQWCAKQGAQPHELHAVMEATGSYHEQAATGLFEAGLTVSVANPANVHDFGGALAMRSKTDKLDSLVLARYGAAIKPAAWQPPPAHVRELRALLSQLEALTKDRTRVHNRREKQQSSWRSLSGGKLHRKHPGLLCGRDRAAGAGDQGSHRPSS